MTIWKYPLSVTQLQRVTMPVGARILDVQVQAGMPCLWAMVEPTNSSEVVTIATFGTGHDLPTNPGEYIGTYQLDTLVFHVFRMKG